MLKFLAWAGQTNLLQYKPTGLINRSLIFIHMNTFRPLHAINCRKYMTDWQYENMSGKSVWQLAIEKLTLLKAVMNVLCNYNKTFSITDCINDSKWRLLTAGIKALQLKAIDSYSWKRIAFSIFIKFPKLYILPDINSSFCQTGW